MGKIKRACFDTGPFIHLHEIRQTSLLELLEEILSTKDVISEHSELAAIIKKIRNIHIKDLSASSKDFCKYLQERHELDFGEATVIALCKQEAVRLLFTDDLEARTVSHDLGFEPHGTLAIILRSYREGLVSTPQIRGIIKDLWAKSSLFLTSDLLRWTLDELDRFDNEKRP